MVTPAVAASSPLVLASATSSSSLVSAAESPAIAAAQQQQQQQQLNDRNANERGRNRMLQDLGPNYKKLYKEYQKNGAFPVHFH